MSLHERVHERITALADELGVSIGEVAGHTVQIHSYESPSASRCASSATVDISGYGPVYDVLSGDPPIYAEICLEGEVVGEITPGHVYSYLGLGRSWVAYADDEMLEAVVDEPIRRCIDPDFIAQYEAGAAARQREAVDAFAKSLYDSKLDQVRDQIRAHQRQIIQYGDALATQYCNLRSEQENLDALLLVRQNNGAETLLREWDQLANHARVARAEFRSDTIVLTTTDDIEMENPVTGDTRWLGRFRIEINPSTLRVMIYNETTPRGSRDHPHVLDHRPCFGGHEHAFSELLSKGELYTLFELLLGYLETFNPDDEYGRYGAYWFDAPDARPTREAAAA